MKLKMLEGKSKSEKYKIIAAAALGAIALLSIGYLFLGDTLFGPTPVATTNKNNNKSNTTQGNKNQLPNKGDVAPEGPIEEVKYTGAIVPAAVGGGRNIFDIYIPPTPPPVVVVQPTPTPTPRPPQVLDAVSPANVYAKTGDFTIQAIGDKFTPETRISFDNNDLPTKFISPQQLTATVPASFIAADGGRQIMVRTPDGMLYSNTTTLNVMAPPMPNYLYVGLIGDKRYKDDVALMRDKNNPKDLFSIKLNETINPDKENRFKIVSISEREVVVVDKTLKIKHTLPYTTATPGTTQGAGAGQGNDTRFPQMNQRGVPQGSIPGIPDNIPRYQPPQQQQRANDDEDDDDDTVKPAARPAPTKRP